MAAAQRRLGDRSNREDDRFLFLEALLSARTRFITNARSGVCDEKFTPYASSSPGNDVITVRWTPSTSVTSRSPKLGTRWRSGTSGNGCSANAIHGWKMFRSYRNS